METLEDRLALSPVQLTANEQYLLELINRGRADPAAEAARYGIALNEGLAPGTISTAAKQALAPNANLLNAARAHLQDMLSNNFFAHNSSNGTPFNARVANFGYSGGYVGENLAWQGTSGTPNQTQFVDILHQALFVDAGVSGRGHRLNLMNGSYKEIGPAVAQSVPPAKYQGYNSVLVGEDFGARSGNSFLTGVVYNDSAVLANNFYTPGEGLGSVTITAVSSTGATFAETTGSAGGYGLQLPGGTYTVTASGGGLAAPIVFNGVSMGGTNVKLDFKPSGGATPPPSGPMSRDITVTAAASQESWVRVFDAATGALRFSFDAYHPSFRGGVRVAKGDITGDGYADVITAAGPGGGPHIRVFDGRTGQQVGGPLGSFFAFDPSFTGGLFLAAGDVNKDGRTDIIVGADAGGGPRVSVFNGADGSLLHNFFAYAPSFAGGIRVAAGDVNGDGAADIITGAGPGGGPHVRVLDGQTLKELAGFFVYAPSFSNGIYVAAGDVNGDGRADIITGAGPGAGPHVRVFDGRSLAVLHSFFAYAQDFTGGVRVSTVDRDGDGRADIVTAAGQGGGPHVQILDGDNLNLLDSFFAITPTFSGGVGV